MRRGGFIQRVLLPDENVLQLDRFISDATAIRVIGLEPGVARLTLTDVPGNEEILIVVVKK
jgi:hypothetical protein